ncbi:MAG: cold shock domain-containing protein [Candidatus Cloacimonetes bacterium]|jgi:cold shock CspA family protein|nr:cold shock domain-containing protein [Candidatus Cloacimonadota bacterium]MCB5287883.1 cold shock domain-containing protein [Candidatus Cloacimonadota bacterium]MCK9184936.1 cold shock domain-containing protein [Candidatus Cloacimonadota bacterium]MCK9583979.1 cold shock domain-containing protein [Candidatus Cloacimonadota bacterium]MDY0230203.1 cold shock domain-containing protein [Candidatus Cloacimonadaceae bacterium]
MKGKIYITDLEKSLGKIVFEDDSETRIMRFPASYESGDWAYVDFVNNDPTKGVISIFAESPQPCFGSIVLPKRGDKPKPSLLVNYPVPLGIAWYDISKVDFPVDYEHRMVGFRLRKDKLGRLSAVDLTQVSRQERYKCRPSSYGSIEQSIILDGFITELKDSASASNEILTGKVSSFWTLNRNSGPVEMANLRADPPNDRVSFFISDYRRKFRRSPVIGETLMFTLKQNSKYKDVQRFIDPADKGGLPKEQQSICVSVQGKDYTLPLTDYEKLYGKAPKAGDIIKCVKQGYSIALIENSCEEAYSFESYLADKAVRSQVLSGIISQYHADKGFGFVQEDTGVRHFFHISAFSKTFNTMPLVGQQVAFSAPITDSRGRQSIIEFLLGNSTCSSSQFIGFVEPQPTDIYAALSDDAQQIVEIRKVNPDNKAEAIGMYKSPVLTPKQKLSAIETMIRHGFSDTRINQNRLRDERLRILQELVKENLTAQNFDLAMTYELRLQKINYDPARLKAFASMRPWLEVLPESDDIPQPNFQSRPWNIDSVPAPLTLCKPGEKAWSLDTNNEKIEIPVLPIEKAWRIDLAPQPDFSVYLNHKKYYEIDIKR